MKDLPNYLKKRKLFYSEKSSPEELKEFGDLFLQEEQWNDAVDFYEKADCREGLEAVGKLSKDAGDFFTFQRIVEILKREVPSEEWEALGDSAQELGRLKDAMKAYQMAQNDIKLEGVKKKIEPKGEKEIEEEHS
jgi:tetratricopeptide (TPR) repeat protein